MQFLVKKNIRLTVDGLKSIPDLDYKKLQDEKLYNIHDTTKDEKIEDDISIIDLRKKKLKRPDNENTVIVPGEVIQYENGQHDWTAYPFSGAWVMDGGTQWNGTY